MQGKTRKLNIKQITFIGLMTAVTIFLGATGLGFIPLAGIKITILHLPTILSAILGGPLIGGITGLFFGIFSLIQNIIAPTPLSFVFYNPLVSILPRVLIGVFSGMFFKKINKIITNKKLVFLLTSIIGTLTNTVLVLSLAGVFHHKGIFNTFQIPAWIILSSIAGTNLPFEILISAFIIPMIGLPLKKYYDKLF